MAYTQFGIGSPKLYNASSVFNIPCDIAQGAYCVKSICRTHAVVSWFKSLLIHTVSNRHEQNTADVRIYLHPTQFTRDTYCISIKK